MTVLSGTLAELLAEDDAKREAEGRAQAAAEQNKYDCLTPEERAARMAEYEEKWGDFGADVDADDDDDEDEGDD